MKLASFFLLLFVFVVASSAQQPTSACPTIEITGPSGVTNPGNDLTFAVSVSPIPANVKYDWKVTGGTIELGQGTQSIVVKSSFDTQGKNIIATVSIGGLPQICNRSASETAPIAHLPEWGISDEWGRMPNDDQRGRLDVFFSELANHPNHYGLFYISVEKKEGKRVRDRKLALILNHAKLRKFDKSRFIFAMTNWDVHSIKLYRYIPGQRAKIDCTSPCKLIYGRDLK